MEFFFMVAIEDRPPNRAVAASSLAAKKKWTNTPPLTQPLLTVVWAKTENRSCGFHGQVSGDGSKTMMLSKMYCYLSRDT